MQLHKAAIICNPKAGTAKGSRLERLVGEFDKHGVEAMVFRTTPEPDSAAMLTIDAQAWGADAVVAFGGDYTVNQVALGLMRFAPTGVPRPMAVFSAGTGNLFARSFYSVPSVESFVRMCREGEPRNVDAIRFTCTDTAGKRHAGILLVALGFGDFSDAIALSSQKLKRRFGPLVYVANVVASIPNFKPHAVTMRARGEVRNATLVSGFVFNTIPPKAVALGRGCNASDGLLDFVGLRGHSLADVASSAKALAVGRPDQSHQYTRWVVPELSIESDRDMLLNLDGDAGPTTRKVDLKVLPAAVRLLVA